MPCSVTVRGTLADRTLYLEDMLKDRLAESLEFSSLTTDSWTSAANRPYMSVTLHWLDKDFHLDECALALEPQPYPQTAQPTALLKRKVHNTSHFFFYEQVYHYCAYFIN